MQLQQSFQRFGKILIAGRQQKNPFKMKGYIFKMKGYIFKMKGYIFKMKGFT
jgi:hypothetical protein